MDTYFYPCKDLAGGGDGYIDAIDGSLLKDGDATFTVKSGTMYVHLLDADSGLAESSPDVIAPDSNAGAKRWILQTVKSYADDGSESLPAIAFSGDKDCGFYRVGTNEFAVTVGGEEVLRFKRSGTSTLMGHPDNFGGEAPFFQVNEQYSTPAVQMQSLFITGEADTGDLALRRINGTSAVPTACNNGEWAGALYWWPYDGTGYDPGAIYGGGGNYADAAANNTAGPYTFNVNLGNAAPTDIAVFVENSASTHMQPANLKTLTTDYNFSYDHNNTALSVTFGNNSIPGNGNTIWAFPRTNLTGTAPFYGRHGAIKVIGSQAPTQQNRGSVMTFEVTKNNQAASRPRMWLDGSLGTFVAAGKAIHEGDTDGQGKFYPDRVNVGGNYLNGAPSGCGPIAWPGNSANTGALAIPAIDTTVAPLISIREWNAANNGFDVAYDMNNHELLVQSTSAGVRSSRWVFQQAGHWLPIDHKTYDIGSALLACDDVYADDFQNVADFLHLDSQDDLGAIRQIQGSGVLDERTGLEMIDDSSVPDWMLTKDKATGEPVYDPDGKPYISLRMMTSLLMGACRKLDAEVLELKKKLAKLEGK